jgi:signal transduction histidine kinase
MKIETRGLSAVKAPPGGDDKHGQVTGSRAGHTTMVDAPITDLAEFLARHRASILHHWLTAVDRASPPEAPPPVASWPLGADDLIDGLTRAVRDGLVHDLHVAAGGAAERLATRALSVGASLRETIAPLATLRDSVLDAWRAEVGAELSGPALQLLHRAIDLVTTAASERYVSAHHETLAALDRISAAAFAPHGLDDLLHRLLGVIVGGSTAIDTGSILLRDGDWLVARAVVGLGDDLRGEGFRFRIGEGFVGRIAAERRPRLVSGDELEAVVTNPLLKAKGLRSLYGLPLQSEGELLGVAHIGSARPAAFSEQDRRLFDAMCARATVAIRLHLLQESSETKLSELETVLESIPDAVIVADGRSVHHANRAALALVGVGSVDELNRSARSLSEVIEARHLDTGEPLAPEERPITRALRGETVTTEIMLRQLRTRADVLVRCAVAPVRSGSAIVGAVAACMDITQRKHEEAERERLYREATQAVADRQHILAVVSHDLRNPLNTIRLAASTLQDDGMPAELKAKGLNAIMRGTTRMNQLISDLLDVASIESGRLAITAVPQDPLALVEEVVDLFSPQAASRGLTLVMEAPGELPLIRGDRHRLLQVLSNLVSNALKVTAAGSVTVRAAGRDAEVEFAVIDTGPGVPEAVRGSIFEPYWRSENATYKGTGLGLAISRGIVEGHGGRIWIESTPGRGAAFLFALPTA